jgi:hypothetical protein
VKVNCKRGEFYVLAIKRTPMFIVIHKKLVWFVKKNILFSNTYENLEIDYNKNTIEIVIV